jgi:HEAT repeat protein
MTRRGSRVALGSLLLALALVPTILVTARAWKGKLELGRLLSRSEKARREVLARIEKGDTSVLINVTLRDMPASPDILNIGRRGTKALERCLSDNVDSNIRAACAAMLGALGDRRALPTLRTALEDWEAPVRWRVIRALERIPDPASFERLSRLYRRKDEQVGNRRAILAALGAISSPNAVQFLRRELKRKPEKDQPDLRPSSFDALWRSRHLYARATLVADVGYALGSDNHGLARLATESAAELRAPGLVRHLIPLMEHPDADVRNKAVYALGRIGDRKATRALLKHLPRAREARMLNNIAFALERLDRSEFYKAIKQTIAHKQAIIRLNAAFVVGDVQRPEGLPLLEKALADDSDYVKTSAIVAVGKLGRAEGMRLLEPFVGHENLSIKQEAIYALNKLSGGQRYQLIVRELLTSEKTAGKLGVRRRAAIELGKLGRPEVADFLLGCYERYRCGLRDVEDLFASRKPAHAPDRLLLAWARGRTELTDLVSRLRPPGVVTIAASTLGAALVERNSWRAVSAVDLVGDLGGGTQHKGLVDQLRVKRLQRTARLREHSLVALARLGDRTAAPRLLAELDNYPAAWLPRLARVVRRIEEPAARAQLLGELERRQKSEDVHVALAASAVLLRWDPERAFFRFLDGLAAQGALERDLAQDYLQRDRSDKVTWLLRRAFARERRPATRDRLRTLLDGRPKQSG